MKQSFPSDIALNSGHCESTQPKNIAKPLPTDITLPSDHYEATDPNNTGISLPTDIALPGDHHEASGSNNIENTFTTDTTQSKSHQDARDKHISTKIKPASSNARDRKSTVKNPKGLNIEVQNEAIRKRKSYTEPSKDTIYLPPVNTIKPKRKKKRSKPVKDEIFRAPFISVRFENLNEAHKSKRPSIKYVAVQKNDNSLEKKANHKRRQVSSKDQIKKGKKKCGFIKRILLCSMCLIIVLLASAVPVALFVYPGLLKPKLKSLQPTRIPTSPPTNSPTNNINFLRPTSSPTSIEYSDMVGYIKFTGITNNTKLMTPETPQNGALEWFISDPIQKHRDKSDKRYLQRFVLGIFYFSLSEESIHGNGWHMCSKGQRCSLGQKTSWSWLSVVDECEWAMLKCDTSGYVTEITALRENNMFGTLPEEIGVLNSLERIELQRNFIYGTIPESWSKLSNLKSLVLSDNYIEDPIPENFFKNLPLLEELILDNNELSGPLPLALSSLTSLIRLRLNFNRFSGVIPSKIKRLSNLVELELIQNMLTGPLVSEIGYLRHLSKLDVSHNMLSGKIPSEILRMGSLNELYLNNNMLSGELSSDIKYFGDQSNLNLKMLRFDSNDLSGTIPSDIGQIQLLRILNFTSNHFSGSVPDEICKLTGSDITNLKFLEVDCEDVVCTCCQPTCFDARIIDKMRDISDIDDIILWKNPRTAQNKAMSWCIFEDRVGYVDLKSFSFERFALATLYFATNGDQWTSSSNFMSENGECQWEGILCDGNEVVNEIILPAHNLVGYIPREIGYLSSLTVFELQANSLMGTIPEELGHLKEIISFYVNNNQLEGTLPNTIYGWHYLDDFSVSANLLTGTINSLVGDMGSLSEERKRYMLQQNEFDGSIPVDFASIPNLVYLGLHSNEFVGIISTDFCDNPMSISIDCFKVSCDCCQCMD